LETSTPPGVVPTSSAFTLLRFCKIRFYFLRKNRSVIPSEIGNIVSKRIVDLRRLS
jgi:hypothetical protein